MGSRRDQDASTPKARSRDSRAEERDLRPEDLNFDLPFGEYYFFVDSPVASGSASTGTYQVWLDKLCPVELIEYTIE